MMYLQSIDPVTKLMNGISQVTWVIAPYGLIIITSHENGVIRVLPVREIRYQVLTPHLGMSRSSSGELI